MRPKNWCRRFKEYAAARPNGKVLIARVDFSTTPPSTPTHELLDRAVSDRPVIVHHTSEHALWVNAKALELAGITDEPVADPDEEKGIVRDASGHPSGVLMEAAMSVMERALQKFFTQEEKLTFLRDASKHLSSYGITSVVNATGNLAEIQLYGILRDRGELTVRTKTSFGAVARETSPDSGISGRPGKSPHGVSRRLGLGESGEILCRRRHRADPAAHVSGGGVQEAGA